MATEKELKQVAKIAAQNAVSQMNESGEEDSMSEVTPPSAASRAHELFDDIFTDIGDVRMRENKMTRYAIYKNGELTTMKSHPYSWEKIQKEMGGGHYRIVAKCEQGTIVKQQSKSVSDPIQPRSNMGSGPVEFEFGDQAPRPAPASGPSFMEMFAMMKDTEKTAKEEARESAAQNQNSSNQTMQVFLQLMQNQQQNSQQMILELSKSSQAIAEKLSENQARMFEKLNERLDRVQETARADKKSDGPSSLDIMKMIQDAEDRGFKRFQTLHELADEKADEKMELMESVRGDSDSGSGKKSLIDSVIEATLPSIATALAQSQQQPAQPAQLAAPAPVPAGAQPGSAYAQPRRPLRAVQAQPVAAAPGNRRPPVQPGTRNPQAPRPQGNPQAGARGSVASRQPGVPVRSARSMSGLPQTSAQEVVQFAEEKKTPSVPTALTETKVLEIAVPIIAGALTSSEAPDLAALKTQEALKEAGFGMKEALSIFTKEVMMGVVKDYQLPPEAHPWFEAYYQGLMQLEGGIHSEGLHAHTQPQSGMDDGRALPESDAGAASAG